MICWGGKCVGVGGTHGVFVVGINVTTAGGTLVGTSVLGIITLLVLGRITIV
jgi:hypothetical protein